ncbi:MAG: ABC transporter substrate-binding protein [Alphaproteobacteria bacterium]|nr:ABC transporter substrate-binding protein [Alphaproteobacteria bacterium]
MVPTGIRRRVLLSGLAATTALPRLAMAQDGGKTIVSHGIAIHGQPGYPADAKHLAYANPDAPKGGMVRYGAQGTFDSLNPFILKGNKAAGIGQLFEALTESTFDEAASEYGLLAESIEYPENRSEVTFNLRPEARWHDGRPVTAEDVVFSFEILKEKGLPFYAFYYHDVLKAEVLGERKVRFAFRSANNRELPVIMGQMSVLPKHWWAARDFEKTTLEAPLGSGPYKVESFEPGRQITYRRVEDWWARDLWINRGRYNFDTIRYDYYRDATVLFEAFKAGNIDLRAENTARNWATGYDFPAVKSGAVKREDLKHERPAGMQCFAFNTRRDMFKDRRVRQAVATMFDFEWSNKNLFHGFYTRNTSFFSNSELASSGLPSTQELAILEPLRVQFPGAVPDEVFKQEFKLPVTDGSGNVRDLARQSIALLKAAGYDVKDGKMVNTASGKPLAFEMLLDNAVFERIVLPYKQNLQRIGVEMNIRTVDTAQFKERSDTFDFDVMSEGFGQSLSPGNEQRDFWGSAAADRNGSRNTIGIKNSAVDKLVDLIIAAPDRPALIVACRALDRVLLWGHYVVPAWHLGRSWVAYWNKFARPATLAKYNPVAVDTWWIDTAKDRALPNPASDKK